MTSFSRKEIVSSTQLVRQLSFFLTNLRNRSIEKIGIVRNNEMEAVIIPIEEYEEIKSLAEKSKKKSIKDYFGTMNDETYSVMMSALADCRKVDAGEW